MPGPSNQRRAHGKDYADVPHNLRRIRQSRDMPIEKLAEMVGVATQTIQRYETQPDRLRVSQLKQLADALDCTVIELVMDRSHMTSERLEAGDIIDDLPDDMKQTALAMLRALEAQAKAGKNKAGNAA